ncbi:hypothetical protein A9Z40_03050 [Microbacterium arborescens]|uniref:Porin n=1 Tax=Microbacterium arborescens TaxID=33883 RepID=A0ABX2WIK6_9MICO|nr:hypothetical protein [Microbacterium arborescens]OAZ40934.1 hypothetical protein A9Z40_03050 [Microbacterium arborescens]
MAVQYGIGAGDLDARGYVKQYPTFRYHNGGTAYFRADNFGGIQNNGAYNDLHRHLNFALGLRNRAGTQVVRVEFAPSQRGTTKPFGRFAAGDYATNARAVNNDPNYYATAYGYGWAGLLTLSGA